MALESRVLHLHQKIYQSTGGVVGHRLIGVPTLLLTTTGRRTGSQRTAALVYAKDDDGSLIVTQHGRDVVLSSGEVSLRGVKK